jgi:CheY-like chemotaxis protein
MHNNSICVLIVEDNDDIAFAYAQFFCRVGFSVRTACNGEEALAFLRERTVDVLISDLRMPTMDGFALAEAITNTPTCSNIHRVAVTAQPLEDVAKRALSAGFDAVFQKPVKMSDLVKWIEPNCALCRS